MESDIKIFTNIQQQGSKQMGFKTTEQKYDAAVQICM